MATNRWVKSWAEGRIGFHAADVHGDLVAHEQTFLGDASRRVLVPLCGKTVDIPWMVARRHQVVGVELVEQAVQQLHDDNDLEPTVEEVGAFKAYRTDGLTVLQGDVLCLEPEHVGAIDRVWDRAALVALDKPTRASYAATLRNVARGATMLLNAFEYDQSLMEGPPYSVPDEEVRALYDGANVEVLARIEVAENVPFQDAGHEYWYVTTYLISL